MPTGKVLERADGSVGRESTRCVTDVDLETNGNLRSVEVRSARDTTVVTVDGRAVEAIATRLAGRWLLLVAPAAGDAQDRREGFGAAAATRAFRSYDIAIADHGDGQFTVLVDGRAIDVSVPQLRRGIGRREGATAAGTGVARIVAPMPGRIVKVLVKPGDEVDARQPLIVVEAMKMENELRSPRRGRVTEVTVVEGALVEAKTVLIVIT
jgi:biotin carboxyl carrier protein